LCRRSRWARLDGGGGWPGPGLSASPIRAPSCQSWDRQAVTHHRNSLPHPQRMTALCWPNGVLVWGGEGVLFWGCKLCPLKYYNGFQICARWKSVSCLLKRQAVDPSPPPLFSPIPSELFPPLSTPNRLGSTILELIRGRRGEGEVCVLQGLHAQRKSNSVRVLGNTKLAPGSSLEPSAIGNDHWGVSVINEMARRRK